MIVVITKSAKADLINIGQLIEPLNPLRAASLVNEILDRCSELADMSYSFPLVPRYAHWGIRRHVFSNCLIFYRESGDRLEIVNILNGAEGYSNLLD